MRPTQAVCTAVLFALINCLGWAGSATLAQPLSVLPFGRMEIAYDGARWQAVRESDTAVTMQPIGDNSQRLDPVTIKRSAVADRAGCLDLARQELAGRIYELPTISEIQVAKLPAVRLTAHTRCRNAMPQGTVICVHHHGNAYLLTANKESCRSGAANLFSGIDPLYEIAAGMTALP